MTSTPDLNYTVRRRVTARADGRDVLGLEDTLAFCEFLVFLTNGDMDLET